MRYTNGTVRFKGSRNALNGALDQGEETAKGPDLDYHLPMFNVSLGDHVNIGVEYWVLSRPAAKNGKKSSTKPAASFVADAKPIILTHNGQNQGELSARIIKKDADLPFLQTQSRLIVHVNCDRLSPAAKRLLFSSTREQAREGFVQSIVQQEIVDLLKSDDELKRLKAREQSLKEKDDAAEKQMQRQVAKLLRIVGPAHVDIGGSKKGGGEVPPKRRGPRGKPQPIEPREPPTYIKILGDKDDEVTFFGGQRKYIGVEIDANSDYHDPDDQKKSRINVVVGDDMKVFGTSPLRGGRMRIGIQCKAEVAVGSKGGIRVELYRPGLSTLSDERDYEIVQPPKPKEDNRQTPFPQVRVDPCRGPRRREMGVHRRRRRGPGRSSARERNRNERGRSLHLLLHSVPTVYRGKATVGAAECSAVRFVSEAARALACCPRPAGARRRGKRQGRSRRGDSEGVVSPGALSHRVDRGHGCRSGGQDRCEY